ncbi:MAG: ATP--guanido phosphotransferase [Clostridia bacterium]|jgi:protein arginine kinase|nr:ATP--guanido phosphotransferase [Clostridia bacterium]
MVTKWYEKRGSDENIIISTRVRLARNLKDYPFPAKMTEKQKEEVITKVRKAAINLEKEFDFIELTDVDKYTKRKMVEKHVITRRLTEDDATGSAVLVKTDEEISIMINEDDHIRIQVICPGDSVDEAYKIAQETDAILEKHLEYAFHDKYGYLTASPGNTGTGLKASYMVHIPILELIGQIKEISSALHKLGMQIKGMYGDRVDSFGSMYYICNQYTMGKKEEAIIDELKDIKNKIINQEIKMRSEILDADSLEFEDKIYKSYANLKYSRIMNPLEAMILLSDVKLGFETGILKEPKLKENIYKIMLMMGPSRLQEMEGRKLTLKERDIKRATYIREQFGKEE